MKTTTLVSAVAALISSLLLVQAADVPAKAYPLDTCFISGDKLGEMGRPIVFIYEGQEIKVCCKDCKKQFDKNPAGWMSKLEKAVLAKEAAPSTGGTK